MKYLGHEMKGSFKNVCSLLYFFFSSHYISPYCPATNLDIVGLYMAPTDT